MKMLIRFVVIYKTYMYISFSLGAGLGIGDSFHYFHFWDISLWRSFHPAGRGVYRLGISVGMISHFLVLAVPFHHTHDKSFGNEQYLHYWSRKSLAMVLSHTPGRIIYQNSKTT